MKLLLDTCVSGLAINFPKSAGHDVIWSAEWESDPGDQEILLRAHKEERILVTIDKDFGELAIVRGFSHAGIVRLVGLRAGQQGPVCAESVGSSLIGLTLRIASSLEPKLSVLAEEHRRPERKRRGALHKSRPFASSGGDAPQEYNRRHQGSLTFEGVIHPWRDRIGLREAWLFVRLRMHVIN